MTKISPAEELFFLGVHLSVAKLLAHRALEIAHPRLLEKNNLKEAIKIRFGDGAERRGRVAIIVNVTNLQEAGEISDLLLDDLITFDRSDPGEPPSVIGSVNREVFLRICLNTNRKLQINIGKEAKAP